MEKLTTWESAGTIGLIHAGAPHTSAALRLLADVLDHNQIDALNEPSVVGLLICFDDEGVCISAVTEGT